MSVRVLALRSELRLRLRAMAKPYLPLLRRVRFKKRPSSRPALKLAMITLPLRSAKAVFANIYIAATGSRHTCQVDTHSPRVFLRTRPLLQYASGTRQSKTDRLTLQLPAVRIPSGLSSSALVGTKTTAASLNMESSPADIHTNTASINLNLAHVSDRFSDHTWHLRFNLPQYAADTT